ALDNVSRISNSLSDALCRIATGGGFATRELYSDSEETLMFYVRPAIVTGITEVIVRGDLADRTSVVTLQPINEDKRLTEQELEKKWAKAWPVVLGGLLDAAVVALRRLPDTEPENLPRLADHARWVTAAESCLGWKPGTYIDALAAVRKASDE